MQPGQKGGPKERGARLLSGWFFYKDTPKSGRVGQAMVFYLSEGQRNEMVGFWPLMENGKVDRAGRGRPRVRPRRISAPTRATPRGWFDAICGVGASGSR
jgi:hypothetical protein